MFIYLAAILRNEVGWFDEEENNSSLVAARLATDAADVKSAIAERISVILQNMTSLLTSFIVAFVIEWRVSLLILATFPLLVLANFAQVIFFCLAATENAILFLVNLPAKGQMRIPRCPLRFTHFFVGIRVLPPCLSP